MSVGLGKCCFMCMLQQSRAGLPRLRHQQPMVCIDAWDRVALCVGAGLDIGFSVHPSAYVVHLPHKKAATYFSTRESGHRDKVRPCPAQPLDRSRACNHALWLAQASAR